MPDLTSKDEILERAKTHRDDQYKDSVYRMRLIVANYLDLIEGTSAITQGKYADIVKTKWEEGRHNIISTNTQTQAKSLVYNQPELRWDGLSDMTSTIRSLYYQHLWRTQRLDIEYRAKLLDLLISGSGNMQVGVRDGQVFKEYVDFLGVHWDTSYKNPYRKRCVVVDKTMPLGEALEAYPALAKFVNVPNKGHGSEAPVVISCYFDRTTRAVLYKRQFIKDPSPNQYGFIPVIETILFQELSAKFPTGMVDLQLGTHKLDLRLQRYFQETVLRSTPVAHSKGNNDEDALDDMAEGIPGTIVRGSDNSDLKWVQGAGLHPDSLRLYELVQQQNNTQSGLNDFQKQRTDSKVEFASQLSLMAQQGGILGQFTSSQHEYGLADDVNALMSVAERFERGPVTLVIRKQKVTFDDLMPINPVLGTDGDLVIKPGGMEYKAPATRLQEAMVLGNVLTQALQMPPGVGVKFMEYALDSYGIDNKKEWLEAVSQATNEADLQQKEFAARDQEIEAAKAAK